MYLIYSASIKSFEQWLDCGIDSALSIYPVKCIHLSLLLSLWPFVSPCWHSCQCLPLCCPLAETVSCDMLNNSAVAIEELTI